jgi:hypothetical protein
VAIPTGSVGLQVEWIETVTTAGSALALLVPGIRADHVHLAATAYDLAMLADSLDARSDLHRATCSLSPVSLESRSSNSLDESTQITPGRP